MAHVQFLVTRDHRWGKHDHKFEPVTPYYDIPCGSDAIFKLDGRNNIGTMVKDAKDRMKQLSSVQTYTGFNICIGSLRDHRTVFMHRGDKSVTERCNMLLGL
jgi:hypothetical protein